MNGERTLDWSRKKNGSLLSGRRTIFERNIKTSGEQVVGTVIFISLQSSLPESSKPEDAAGTDPSQEYSINFSCTI